MKKTFFLVLYCLLSLSCCSSSQRVPISASDLGFDVRSSTDIIDPLTGDSISWHNLMSLVAKSDVVLLGEQHDHSVGHAVQLAVVTDVMERWPESILAMEMLERDEQILVDDLVDEIIDSERFTRLTESSSWGGKDGWVAWYQPIIDVAIESGGGVIAANAPRRYLKLARVYGFEKIDELPEGRRSLVNYPEELSSGRYRQRFWEWSSHQDSEDEKVEIDVTTIDPDDPMLPYFRSQQVWDATMANSIAIQQPTIEKKVLLLVGQFHIEYNGGIVQVLKRRLPKANVLSISIQREIPDIDEEDWKGTPPIADIMIVGEDPDR
ncbi:ChaN family lipoprotein [PVC group bacterium]|nr:ChaN family lipoprotein [PVC group bacterium]